MKKTDMKVKLYRKFVTAANVYFINHGRDESYTGWLYGRQQLKGEDNPKSGLFALVKKYLHAYSYDVALAFWKYNENGPVGDEFRHKYRRYSRKYWTPEAQINRMLNNSGSWYDRLIDKFWGKYKRGIQDGKQFLHKQYEDGIRCLMSNDKDKETK